MFKQHNIITAVELGTSKICVLIGEYQGEELNVIGFAEAQCNDIISKGEIISMDAVQEKLVEVLEAADKDSGNELNDSSMIVMSVTGCDIDTLVSEGGVWRKGGRNQGVSYQGRRSCTLRGATPYGAGRCSFDNKRPKKSRVGKEIKKPCGRKQGAYTKRLRPRAQSKNAVGGAFASPRRFSRDDLGLAFC